MDKQLNELYQQLDLTFYKNTFDVCFFISSLRSSSINTLKSFSNYSVLRDYDME